MKSLKMLRRLLLPIACLAFLTSCGPNADAPQEDPSHVVKIGAILPLSGNYAFAGEDVRNGFLLAQERLKNGPYKFEFIFEDNASENAKTVAATQKLLNVDHADVIVSFWSTAAELVAPLANAKNTLHFSICWDPYIAHKYKSTLTHETTVTEWARAAAELLEKQGLTKIALFDINLSGYQLVTREFKKISAGKIQIASEQIFNPGTRDFRTIIAKAKQIHPQAYVLFTTIPETEILLTQLKESNVKEPITGYLEDVKNMKLLEGLYFAMQTNSTPEFNALFEKRFGKPFDLRAPYAYDILNLLALAYNDFPDHKPTAAEIKARLTKVRNYPGAVGVLNIDRYGVIESPASFKQVRDGKLVPFVPGATR